MDLRRELYLATGALVVLNLILAFGSIGLLVRMGPAIERILEENVVSIMAAEAIISELAYTGESPVSAAAAQAIEQALEQVKANVTEAAERPVVAALEQHLPGAMRGETSARHLAVSEVRELIRVNREAMQAADNEARRLGSAGGWAAVLVGFLSFSLSLLVWSRLERRLVRPLLDLYEVLETARQGGQLRRCRTADAPRELTQVADAVNRLLDERLQRSPAETLSRARLREVGGD